VTEFRRKVKAAGSHYRVVKNSLALRAAKGTALEKLGDKLGARPASPTPRNDPVALAKVLVDFAKDTPSSREDGVVSGSQLLDANGVKSLSTMPGLPELRSRLLGLLQARRRSWCGCWVPGDAARPVLQAHQEETEGN